MRIGIVSDTHGYFDPRLEVLEGVDVILHAGDVGSLAVLDGLRQIAAVHAVQGNVDSPALGLPLSFTRVFDRVQVEMRHILPAPQSQLEKWAGGSAPSKAQAARDVFLQSFDPTTRVVIFGHSHAPFLAVIGRKLFFNPGSAGKRRFSLPRCCGLLEISIGGITATIEPLERYNGQLPISIRWDPEQLRPQ
jgi:uncharacterized protein